MVDNSTASGANSIAIPGEIELLTGNTCDGTDLGTITKVELRVYGIYKDAGTKHDVILRPIFGGGDGNDHPWTCPVSAAWSSYIDITSDTNAPGAWTWSNVDALDCDVEADTADSATIWIAKIEIRVTYQLGSSLSSSSFSSSSSSKSSSSSSSGSLI